MQRELNKKGVHYEERKKYTSNYQVKRGEENL